MRKEITQKKVVIISFIVDLIDVVTNPGLNVRFKRKLL